MSIVIVFRPPHYFAQTQESTLRLRMNRDNRYFFYEAARMDDAEWADFRDAEVRREFDALSWRNILETPVGDLFQLAGGMGEVIARRAEDDPSRFDIVHVSARRHYYDCGSWHVGDPPRDEWVTEEKVRSAWDELRARDWQAIFDARWERRKLLRRG